MNTILAQHYHRLTPSSKNSLLRQFAGADKMLRLIHFLDKHPEGKFTMHDVVNEIYRSERESFSVLQNRYFKLRKKLQEALQKLHPDTQSLLPLEATFFRCRQMVNDNNFARGRIDLQRLLDECKRLNVFELLPSIYQQLVYCNMALNYTEPISKLLKAQTESVEILNAFLSAQVHARSIYVPIMELDFEKAEKHLKKLRQLQQQYKRYPRFAILYYFTMVTSSFSLKSKFNIPQYKRELKQLQILIRKYPDMPALNYEAHTSELMDYYIAFAEAFFEFQLGNLEKAHEHFIKAWDIIERVPGFRLRKTESQFSNRITFEIATGRYREAINTAEALIAFQKQNNLEDKRLKAYSNIIEVYTYAHPEISCPNPNFLLQKMDQYIRVIKTQENSKTILAGALSLKAIFLLINGNYSAASKLASHPEVQKYYQSTSMSEYQNLLKINPKNFATKGKDLLKRLELAIESTERHDLLTGYIRARKILLSIVQ